jgi:hypothetical protein
MCAVCSEVVTAVLDPDYEQEDLRNVRLAPILFNRQGLELTADLAEFVRKRPPPPIKSVEKRTSRRFPTNGTAAIQGLNQLLAPIGSPSVAAVRNLSTTGIGLLHEYAVIEPLMAIEMDSGKGEIQLLVRIARCRPMGPFFDLAGEFLSKMGRRASVGFGPAFAEPADAQVPNPML